MGLVIPVDYGLVSMCMLISGDSEEMVWTFGVSTSAAAEVAQIPSLCRQSFDDHLSAFTQNDGSLNRVVLKVGPNSTGATYEDTNPVTGSGGTGKLMPNTAVLVKKTTLDGGRKGRGRFYVPAFGSIAGDLDSAGNITGTAPASLQTAFSAFKDDIEGDVTIGPAPWVLLHSDSTTPSPIVDLVVESKIATQRRRLRP